MIALNYLDPICVDGDGCLGLAMYPIDLTCTHITLADDPDLAEVGRPAPRRDDSGVVLPCGKGSVKPGLTRHPSDAPAPARGQSPQPT